MTDEKKPFSFAAPFTAPSADPAPAPAPKPASGITLDDVLNVGLGLSSTWLCTREEASEVYEKTRSMRQQGQLRIKYENGILTVRRVKD